MEYTNEKIKAILRKYLKEIDAAGAEFWFPKVGLPEACRIFAVRAFVEQWQDNEETQLIRRALQNLHTKTGTFDFDR